MVMHPLVMLQRMLLVGMAYYGGAWLGVTQTITAEGIAILWPPNAVLLTAFLLLPSRQWPLLAVAALIAEGLADTPAFPLWAAMAFGVVNVLETSLAAWLIRRAVAGDFDFDRLDRAAYFLLYGPLLASSLAALLGAAVYLLLDRSESSYWSLWRLWWFGDALGLLLLTPLLVVMTRWIKERVSWPHWHTLLELFILWSLLLVVGFYAFPRGLHGEGFYLTTTLLLPFAAWAAIRFGVRGAAATVAIISAMAVGFMVRGLHPYTSLDPQLAVWLMQEYLAVVALLSIGLAILLQEIRQYNEQLEQRVDERTIALRRSNLALEQANQRLNELASTDYLTGIANRRYFYEHAQRELERLARGGQQAALILFDLDYFKKINDRYGHEAGDRVLNCVVEAAQEAIRPMDLFGRFGGEEFLILLPDTQKEVALEIAERMRNRIEQMQCSYQEQLIKVTLSLGVAAWDGRSPLDLLIRQADEALYQAKALGRNRVQVAE